MVNNWKAMAHMIEWIVHNEKTGGSSPGDSFPILVELSTTVERTQSGHAPLNEPVSEEWNHKQAWRVACTLILRSLEEWLSMILYYALYFLTIVRGR